MPVTAHISLKDTVIRLDDIEITTSRLNHFGLGIAVERVDSRLFRMNNALSLSELFFSHSGIAMKQYGPGGLSTLSMRGGNAAHTAVLWNGINIQSPMNGMSNLSIFPSFLIKNVSVQRGGSGSLYGSGAVGGVIHISDRERFHQPNNITCMTGYGSFNKQDYFFSAKTGDNLYAFTMKMYFQSADNNFPFKNTTRLGHPVEKQTNAGIRSYGFMPGLQVRTSKKSILSISSLYQKFNKDIQTMMTKVNPNQDSQADVNFLLTANWKYVGSKHTFLFKSGILRNRIILIDKCLPNPEETPVSDNTGNSLIHEGESRFFIQEGQILSIGINFTHESGESMGYLKKAVRDRLALFASWKLMNLVPGMQTVFSFRQEFEKHINHPVTYTLGTDYHLSDHILFKGNISKNYRIPSFNDLYWKPDTYARGNPLLKPESGYAAEIGSSQVLETGAVKMEFSQTLFRNTMNDLILWLPDNQGIWFPENKEKARTRGLELTGNGEWLFHKMKFDIHAFYTRIRSTLTTSDSYNNKPVIYVPKHRFMASFNWHYKEVSANFTFNHNSKRYYDHSHTLPQYSIGNLTVQYELPVKGNLLSASFRIDNLWNTKYQTIAWYAMPLRNYHLALQMQINTKY